MNRFIRSLAAAGTIGTLALSMAACGSSDNGTKGGSGGASAGADVKIGVVLEQTGALASLALPELNAIKLAVDEFNSAGGKVSLVTKDSASDPATAAAVTRSLVGQVPAVLGSATGASCRAMQPILAQAKILQYCQSPQNFTVTPQFFYGLTALADYPAATIPWLRDRKIHTIAIVGQDDATGDASAGIFNAIAKQFPSEFKVVADQRFASGASNIETQVTKVRDAKPDLVAAVTSGGNIVPVVKAMNALGMKQPLYVATGSAGRDALALVQNEIPAGGMYSNAFWVNVPDEIPANLPYADKVKKFVADYSAKYGNKPSHTEAGAFDSAMQVMDAIKAGNDTGEKIATYLETHPYTGVLGDYTFSKDRHQGAKLPPVIMTFDSTGKFKLAFNSGS